MKISLFMLVLYIIIFNIYFYFDIVEEFKLTHGIVKLVKKAFKKVDFLNLLRRLYNFVRSHLQTETAKAFILELYDKFIKLIRK